MADELYQPSADTTLVSAQSAIFDFDRAFEDLIKDQNSGSNEEKMQMMLSSIMNLPIFSGIMTGKNENFSLSSLFSHEHTEIQKAFIASILLQAELLCVNFITHDTEHRMIDLFDAVLETTLYKEMKILPKDQTYKKISTLKEALMAVDKSLLDLISKFSIDNITTFQQSSLRLLKSKKVLFFIGPFVDINDMENVLKTCISKIISYKESVGIDTVDKYRSAELAIESFISLSKRRENKYSSKIFFELGKTMLLEIQNNFSSSPYGKETSVSLYGAEKKYPRNGANGSSEFNLRCIVEVKGPGIAFELTVKAKEVTSCTVLKSDIYLGNIEPGRVTVEISVRASQFLDSYLGEFEIEWMNGSKEKFSDSKILEFFSQNMRVNWDLIKSIDPYVIDEVDTVNEFVGRSDLLSNLESLTSGIRIGSAFISGQKRIGKTSLAKTLKSIIDNKNNCNFLTIYVEGGLYIRPSPEGTIADLGKFLCNEISASRRELKEVEHPKFTDAFSPFVEYLRRAKRVSENLRILFILDEFDELPIDLYRPNEISNSFFLSLRSVANEKDFGFIMVGGEKMAYILNCQGHALNKFESFRVDYFERGAQWGDFSDLVRRPSRGTLDFADAAITALYEKVNGHPFYTKLICKKLFRQMADKRDTHVTEQEINEAYNKSIEDARGNSFQHFWTDGIFEPEPRAETVRTERRKFLIVLAECISERGDVLKSTLMSRAERSGINGEDMKRTLQAFIARDIFMETGDLLRCKVPFFAHWLKRQGVNEIITTMSTLDAILEYKKSEQDAFVKSNEITSLISSWGIYAGRSITEDQVRSWLGQFGDNFKQRSMFHLLQSLKFYGGDEIRAKMRLANGIVNRGKVRQIESGKRKRDDIFVSYIDGPGKSGARYAKIYADENGIYADNVIEKSLIEKHMLSIDKNVSLVFVDDFVGTGKSTSEYMKELSPTLWKINQINRVSIHFIALCGFKDGILEIDRTIEKLNINVKTNCIDIITDEDKCFSENSKFFKLPSDRIKAREIAYEIGLGLEKNAPLGFGNCESAVIFEDSCPNNNLPILWSRHKTWTPLFKRM